MIERMKVPVKKVNIPSFSPIPSCSLLRKDPPPGQVLQADWCPASHLEVREQHRLHHGRLGLQPSRVCAALEKTKLAALRPLIFVFLVYSRKPCDLWRMLAGAPKWYSCARAGENQHPPLL